MSSIWIFKRPLTEDAILALLTLLGEAGVPTDQIGYLDEVGPAGDSCDDQVIIFLLDQATCSLENIDVQLAAVPDGGRRAICIWPEVGGTALPSAAMKFAYSIVSWNSESLRKTLADDDVTCFETSAGEALPVPDTERLECP
jgi:hypothetical protein